MIDILNAANANLQRQIHAQQNAEVPKEKRQEEQLNSMHLEDLQTQDQDRQLMSVEDTDLERQHANQQQSQTDSTPGIEGSHEEEEQSVRQEHEAQM